MSLTYKISLLLLGGSEKVIVILVTETWPCHLRNFIVKYMRHQTVHCRLSSDPGVFVLFLPGTTRLYYINSCLISVQILA